MTARRLSLVALAVSVVIANLPLGPIAAGEEMLTPSQIVARALENNTFSASNATAQVNLLVSKDGKRVRERQILTKVRRDSTQVRAFVEFRAPADVAGTKFLSIEKRGQLADQYIYLPAFRKVKRVIGAERSGSFMGTDFAYADLDGHEADDADWKRLPDEEIAKQGCYVLEGTPKEARVDAYGRSVVWVHKAYLVPMRIDFFDRDRRTLKKRLTVHRLEKKSGRWLASDSEMETPKRGTKTELVLGEVDFVTPIPDEELGQRALER